MVQLFEAFQRLSDPRFSFISLPSPSAFDLFKKETSINRLYAT